MVRQPPREPPEGDQEDFFQKNSEKNIQEVTDRVYGVESHPPSEILGSDGSSLRDPALQGRFGTSIADA